MRQRHTDVPAAGMYQEPSSTLSAGSCSLQGHHVWLSDGKQGELSYKEVPMNLDVPCLSFSQSGVTREGLDAIDGDAEIELDLQ